MDTQEKPKDLYLKLRRIDPEAAKASARAYKKWWRQTEGGKRSQDGHRHKKWPKALKPSLVRRARIRARAAGIEATITTLDIAWPDVCPVLGIRLDYSTPKGKRDSRNPALPSLDRWDNSKGYVPGNVFVISMRANILKSNATADELEAVARYARHGCGALEKGSE